jgi:PAS domain S-box-containing protein
MTEKTANGHRSSAAMVKRSAEDLRQRAEEKARTMTPLCPEHLTPGEVQGLVSELRIHQIELELQNDELRRAQEAVATQLARYRDLYDLLPLALMTVSEAGLILEANLRAATLLGVARDTLLRQPLSRFILPEDQDIYYQQRRQLVVTGESQVCELRLVPEEGRRLLARLEAVVAPGQEIGAPVYRVMVSDITASKQLEAEARENAANLAAILQGALAGILIIDALGTIMTINPTAAARLGKGMDELRGASLYSALPKAVAASQKARIEVAVNSRTPVSFSDERQGRHYANTIYPVCEPSGKVARVIILVWDITERVVAEGIIRQDKEAMAQQVRARTADLEEEVAVLRRERDGYADTMTTLRGLLLPVEREVVAATPSDLTTMEAQVATLIKQGKKTREIATLLQLSPRTVDSHRNKIRKKMGIQTRTVTLGEHLGTYGQQG